MTKTENNKFRFRPAPPKFLRKKVIPATWTANTGIPWGLDARSDFSCDAARRWALSTRMQQIESSERFFLWCREALSTRLYAVDPLANSSDFSSDAARRWALECKTFDREGRDQRFFQWCREACPTVTISFQIVARLQAVIDEPDEKL
jgi:hypothetical protein